MIFQIENFSYKYCNQVFSNLLQNIYKLLMHIKKRINILFIFIIQNIHISMYTYKYILQVYITCNHQCIYVKILKNIINKYYLIICNNMESKIYFL